jgi:hypothetical protein
MECRRCAACEQMFQPRAQVPHQRYCAQAACQRERRRCWQQSKLRSDADYRANQVLAQRAWADGHGDYWREYRQPRQTPFLQGLTVCWRRPPVILQRRTRGRSKSP